MSEQNDASLELLALQGKLQAERGTVEFLLQQKRGLLDRIERAERQVEGIEAVLSLHWDGKTTVHSLHAAIRSALDASEKRS